MCGIAGALPADDEFVAFALAKQGARGPDQTAAVDLGFCSLGVNRLAISGLVGGDQPLVSASGDVAVVFNGAIYNAPRLIDEFGLDAPSSNDGEVIHGLYARFGLEFADYLEGMFAICLADVARGELVIAVDQVGIKPLYRWRGNGRIRVASVLGAFPPELWNEVERVPPGMVFSSSGSARRIRHRYVSDGALGDLLSESVAEQIPAEVPWGCMLSGGVDSAVVARLASEHASDVRTFTCGIEGSPDLAAAREVATAIRSKHHEIVVDRAELVSVVDTVVEATASFERSTVMAGVGTYFTARAAREQGVKVLLSGEGADELFGGYREFEQVDAQFLNAMLLKYQVDLGATECLRLDRGTMAHGVEARVPYLSTSVMRHARRLGPDAKIRSEHHTTTRKVALREYAATILPRGIAYREKAEFSRGAGLAAELRALAPSMVSEQELRSLAKAVPSFPMPNALSAWFVSRWLAIFGTRIGSEWTAMVRRGLFRQHFTEYLPVARDSALYWRA